MTASIQSPSLSTAGPASGSTWFPGPVLGGLSLTVAPLLLLAATLLRSPFDFFYKQQLAAFGSDPTLMVTAYTLFLAGTVALWPGIVSLVRSIAHTRPTLARWAGGLVVTGLLARTFHAGVDQAAFSLARHRGVEFATAQVGLAYQDEHLFSYLSFTIMFGWFVLAFAVYRSGHFTGVVGKIRAVALATMGLLPLGVLKGTELLSIVGTVGLCVALLPEGVRLLRTVSRPTPRAAAMAALTVVGLAAFAYLSTQG
ncbi:hypothetical protein GCM10022243_20350 [Saccharothrix violaceirubra]|uniref:Uncharacterized protein n=1 Tax=Saccharothrix violaceirubra TaxID=413306 RepID=A0A7W7T201_9PSEU|nr:hypothetical protein [Saccharothrix violaceirubra]MBB4965061.1 hypothetical protein [Saccharothrix violaceirubra]